MICTDEGKNTISIEKSRELISFLSTKSSNSSYGKVVYIENAHFMTIPAQNALLKILEEPPKMAQIILGVDHAGNLLDTVVSRCKIVNSRDVEERQYESQDVTDIKALVNMNIGARVDWVTNNRELFPDRQRVVQVLSEWERYFRELMIERINDLDAENICNQIRKIQKTRLAVEKNNANTMLGVEMILVGL
jgi:hypothetical protein